MNRDGTSDEDERLSQLLQTWRVDEPLPPRFGQDVWRRLAHDEAMRAAAPGVGLLERLKPWWEASVRRPAFAAAYLGMFLAAGLSIGFWQAEHYADATEAAWRAAYVQSVSPTGPAQH